MSGIATVSEYGKYIDLQNYTGSPVENSGSITLSGSTGAEIVYFNRGLNTAGSVEAESSFIIGSADLNEADMEKLDGITNGTVAASKAVVVDASLDASGFRNVTMTGDMTAGTVTMTGFTVDADRDTALKSLAVDNGSTIGCDADTDLMTLAAGALTVAGTLSCDTSFTLDSTTLNATELGYVDGVTAGTAAASKALVLDANSTVGTVYAATVTHLTASRAKIETLDVNTINSISTTVNDLEVADRRIVAALSASAANADGGGLRVGGGGESHGHMSLLWDNSNSAMDFNIGGTTEMRLADGVLRPESDNDVDLGASGAEFKDLYLDGVAYIDDLRADALGAALNCASQAMTNINVDGGAIDGTVIGANSAAAGTFAAVAGTTATFSSTLTANGDVDLGNATSDTVTVTGRFDSDLVPSSDSARDLGTSALQWADIHADAGYIDAITVTGTSTLTTVDINGGAIDGTTVGASSAAAGTFTTLVGTTVSGSGLVSGKSLVLEAESTIGCVGDTDLLTLESGMLDIAGEISGSGASAFGSLHCDSVNLDGGNIDGTTIGAASAAAATVTTLTLTAMGGNWTNASRTVADMGTVTTMDLNGGSIDGTVIGAASAAAGTFAALVGTSLSVSDGNITNVGDIALDSISADGTQMDITLTDNQSGALEIKQGGTNYLSFDTSDGDEHIVVGKMLELGDDGAGVDFKCYGGTANHFMLYDASENRLEFSQDGSNNHITIGGDASGEYAFDVADGSNAKNKIRAAAFVTYSDERLKTDVAPIEDALSTVNSLNAVNFTWKKDGSRDFGFMAQDLKKSIPQAVHGNEEGLYGVDYGRLTSVLVAAIQEQSVQINALKAKLENK